MRLDTDLLIQTVTRLQGITVSRSIDSAEYIFEHGGREVRLSDVDVYMARNESELKDLLTRKLKEVKNED